MVKNYAIVERQASTKEVNEVSQDHERYLEMKVTSCNMAWSSINLFVFKKDRKLRLHAVNHLLNTSETEVWETIFQQRGIFNTVESGLKTANCPWPKDGREEPPCEFCPEDRYELCGEKVAQMESRYVEAVVATLEEGFDRPCHVHYITDEGERLVAIDQKRPVVVKVARLDEGLFNVMTGYVPTDRFSGRILRNAEALDKVQQRLIIENAHSIVWCLLEVEKEADRAKFMRKWKKKKSRRSTERCLRWDAYSLLAVYENEEI